MLKNTQLEIEELLRQAVEGIDNQVAKLRAQRDQLAGLVVRASVNTDAIETLAPAENTRRKFSNATKAKLKASAQARWERVRAEKAKALKAEAAAQKIGKKAGKKGAKAKPAPVQQAPVRKARLIKKATLQEPPKNENA